MVSKDEEWLDGIRAIIHAEPGGSVFCCFDIFDFYIDGDSINVMRILAEE